MKYHACEWCERPATYKIEASDTNYVRYSCGEHGRQTEHLVDLDLGNGMRKHTLSSDPFPIEDAQ